MYPHSSAPHRQAPARPQTASQQRGMENVDVVSTFSNQRASSDSEDVQDTFRGGVASRAIDYPLAYDVQVEEDVTKVVADLDLQSMATGGSHMQSGGGGALMSSSGFRPAGLKCVNTLTGHHSGVRAIAVHNDRVVTGSYDNLIKVWSVETGACEATLDGHTAWIRCLLMHAREPLLYSGSDDGLVKVWRVDSFKLVHDLRHESEPCGGILALAIDYDREWLIAGSYCASIFVHDLRSYQLLHRLRGHRSAVRSLVVYNSCLLSGSYDRTVKLWDLADAGAALGSLGTRGSVWVLAAHDGLLLGAIGDSSIKVWRMDTWEQIATLSGHRGLVLALTVYRDRLISGSDDRCIRVWRMHTWECERILTGHNGGVVGVCMVNGNLISASNDSLIKVWNASGIQRPFTSTGIRR